MAEVVRVARCRKDAKGIERQVSAETYSADQWRFLVWAACADWRRFTDRDRWSLHRQVCRIEGRDPGPRARIVNG